MVEDQYKVIGIISPQRGASTLTAAVSQVVDTSGYKGGKLVIIFSWGDAAGNAAKLKVLESDDNVTYTNLMSATDIQVDGSAGALPTSSTDNSEVVFDIPLEVHRKRYFTVEYTNASGNNFICCTAVIIGKTIGSNRTPATGIVRANSKLLSTKDK